MFYYRNNGALPGSNDPKNSETVQSDDLEFNGSSPHAFDQSETQQEMQQSIAHDQHLAPTSSTLHPDDQASAILPPRPIYPKAPRTPLQQDLEPVDTGYYGAQPHDPHGYLADSNPYREYGYESGDYDVSSRHPPSTVVLPIINVDTRLGYGLGAESLPFPAADYSR